MDLEFALLFTRSIFLPIKSAPLDITNTNFLSHGYVSISLYVKSFRAGSLGAGLCDYNSALHVARFPLYGTAPLHNLQRPN